MKKRLDLLLVEKGFTPSREKAQRLILAGQVLVDDYPETKPGHSFPIHSVIRIRGDDCPYVSRGGVKLARALEAFKIQVKDKVALDVGASTGGFTHVLLLEGIKKVFAIDVGHNQMAWEIRNNPQVIVREKLNARYIQKSDVPDPIDLIVMDVSFISLTLLFEPLLTLTHEQTEWVTLIKPQFEIGKDRVGKGGIVTHAEDHQEVIARVTDFAKSLGLNRIGLVESPITGTDGNKEFLAHWIKSK